MEYGRQRQRHVKSVTRREVVVIAIRVSGLKGYAEEFRTHCRTRLVRHSESPRIEVATKLPISNLCCTGVMTFTNRVSTVNLIRVPGRSKVSHWSIV